MTHSEAEDEAMGKPAPQIMDFDEPTTCMEDISIHDLIDVRNQKQTQLETIDESLSLLDKSLKEQSSRNADDKSHKDHQASGFTNFSESQDFHYTKNDDESKLLEPLNRP